MNINQWKEENQYTRDETQNFARKGKAKGPDIPTYEHVKTTDQHWRGLSFALSLVSLIKAKLN